MKFATLQVSTRQLVALLDTETRRYWALQELVPGFSGDAVDLIARFDTLRAHIKPNGEGKPLAEAKILAPIPEPRRNIFCIGKNYHDHAVEFSNSGFDTGGEQQPLAPNIFTKAPSTVIGPGQEVPSHPEVAKELDYEAELVVVIGKGGRGIKKADAYDHVFGYMIANDFTARDLQKRHRQWFLGKSLDGFCPCGPYLVSADEVDLTTMTVQCWINGELRQSAAVSQLIFDIPTIIETISAGIALHPGDMIATGTPAGVGIGFNPPRFLKSGDHMRIEITGLGVLENQVG